MTLIGKLECWILLHADAPEGLHRDTIYTEYFGIKKQMHNSKYKDWWTGKEIEHSWETWTLDGSARASAPST
jgi:hypothetical protein